MNRITIKSAAAPKITRPTTTVKVGSSRTTTPLKKNDPPHRMDRVITMPHSSGVMDLLMAGFADIGNSVG